MARGSCGLAGPDAFVLVETKSGQRIAESVDTNAVPLFFITVSIPSDTAPGSYNVFVSCFISVPNGAGATGGPSPLTVAGEPLASEPLAVVAQPTFTG